MNNIKNAIYVISKLDFNDLAVGAKPSIIKDNNLGVDLKWTVSDFSNGEIKEANGVKILNFKTNNYKIFTTISGVDLKNGSIQFEADILIPSVKSDNIFFNVANSSNTGFRFNIKSVFKNGLEILFGTSRVAFSFLFESNKKYNIVVSKDYNVYSLYIDGMIVGHCVSNDFNNLINVNSTPTITIGAKSSSSNADDDFIGDISNVNISFGVDSNKYSNSFTKYGDHLISRLNFGNLASASSATVFTPDLEAVIDSPMNWVYGNVTAISEFGMLDGSPFSSSIGDVGTIYFTMNTDKNVSDIELINFNDRYKVVYTFNVKGEPQPEVTVNDFTTSALDFENELVDKVGTTVWQKEGTANVTNVNKIFGDASFETKALGDGLSTTSTLITGGATPYTIEFYALIKSDNLQTLSDFHPIITSKHLNGVGGGSQGLYLNKTTNQFMYQRTTDIEPNFGVDGDLNFNNNKIAYNEINKITIAFDGVALRFFVNDVLDYIIGTSNGHYVRTFFHLYSHPTTFDDTTKGIIDNINIFDGIATKLRDHDPNEEFLVVDLAFDGENNSTKIVDNGTLKSNWMVNGNATLSTTQKFDGFSSLYLPSINDYIYCNSEVFDFNKENDYTISFSIIRSSTSKFDVILTHGKSTTGSKNISLIAIHPSTDAINPNKLYIMGKINSENIRQRYVSDTQILANVRYDIDIIVKSGVLYYYINGKLDSHRIMENDLDFTVDTTYIGYAKWDSASSLKGYIKNFKIYKGVAVIPESPVGKIQLDFDNNLNDKYKNSNWTNNGVTFDQVNSVKGYSAYFDDNALGIKSGINNNLNFENKNFIVDFDFKAIELGRQNNSTIITSAQVGDYNSFSVSIPNGSTTIVVNTTNDTMSAWGVGLTSAGTSNLSNDYRNIKISRFNNSFILKDNDVVRSIANINTTQTLFDLNGGGDTIIGTARNDLVGTKFNGYIDNFKSIKDYKENIIIDKPAIHLPLETNATNIGFTQLTINSVGNPSYTTIDGKKCVKFETGKYLTITANNIFNLGASSDFYIEFDFYINKWLPSTGSNNRVYILCTADADAFGIRINQQNGSLEISLSDTNTVINSHSFTTGQFYTIKVSRKGLVLTTQINDEPPESTTQEFNIQTNDRTIHIGGTQHYSNTSVDGYASNFKMFVGTSEIPETYNDKKVLDLDFKPTRKSYLFKDNNNKCVIHPVNITQRDYQDSQYCCTFNGIDQYLQLGKNDLLNFGYDDFVINVKFKLYEYYNGNSSYFLLHSGESAQTNERFIIGVSGTSNGTESKKIHFITTSNNVTQSIFGGEVPLNQINDLLIYRSDGVLYLKLNNDITSKDFNHSINGNLGDNTLIGSGEYNPTTFLNGTIYSIKVLRNTTDLSLLDEETTVYASEEKFTLTNGTEAETIEFTEVKERDVKIVTNTDTMTLKVDDVEIEVPKTSTIGNIELFKDYTSKIKDVRVYDIPLQDDDEFIGSELIDTQYPELELLDDGEELQVINIGDFVIKGFIEGGVGRNYIIRNKVENFELIKGTDDYFYDGIDERYIDNYEIHEVESKQSYPLPKHVMERGVISGIVDTGKCNGAIGKIKPSDMTVWCYSNKDQRLIGSYPVSVDGTYLIPNLDVHTRYDIIFKHNSRLVENISSSYRKPKRVEDAKNPRIIGIDYEYNQNSSFIKYMWHYSTNVTFSSVKLYITENPIIDNTTPFIELCNNVSHYNDYNVTHDHQYYVTIVATYEGREYRSNQMLVNTYDRTPTVLTSVEFDKTTGNILLTW